MRNGLSRYSGSALLFALVAVGAGLGCRATGALPPRPETQPSVPANGPATGSDATEKPTSAPAITPPIVPSSGTAGPGELPFGYRFLTSPDDLPAGPLIIYRDAHIANRLDYVTWEGKGGPLFEIDAPMRADGLPSLWYGLARGSRGFLSIGLDAEIVPVGYPTYLLVDLQGRRAWGYFHGCLDTEYPSSGSVVGGRYWAYRCRGEQAPISLASLEEPSERLSLPLPNSLSARSPMFWVSEEELLLVDAFDNSSYCIGRVQEWDPYCATADFAILSLSADGEWVEVREAYLHGPEQPERVGVLPASCLWDLTPPECEPAWAQVNGVIESWPSDSGTGERILVMGGAFSPDGSRLMLLSGEESTGLAPGTVPAKVWIFDVNQGVVQRLASIPLARLEWPAFRKDSIYSWQTAPLWSSDGEWVLLEDGFPLQEPGPIFKISVETGETRRLVPLAGEVLGTLNVP